MEYSYNAFGSVLKIISKQEIEVKYLSECKEKINAFENKYSRFIKDNYLYNLNLSGTSHIDEEFKTLFRLCQKVNIETDGYFDITILSTLEKLGYGKTYNLGEKEIGMSNITIDNDIIKLNGTTIEMGGIGKGYMIDWIFSHLFNKYKDIVIDFGGDIRVGEEKKIIGLEDPYDSTKILGSVVLQNCALGASAGNKRKFKGEHHLINAHTGHSQNDKIAVFTKHKLAVFADVYATALFVCPLEKSLEILKKIPGLDALIIEKNGEIYESENFGSNLNI